MEKSYISIILKSALLGLETSVSWVQLYQIEPITSELCRFGAYLFTNCVMTLCFFSGHKGLSVRAIVWVCLLLSPVSLSYVLDLSYNRHAPKIAGCFPDPSILSRTIRTVVYVGTCIHFVRTTYLCCKDHPSFCGFKRTANLCCKDHHSCCGFIRNAYSCCKDHPLFCCFIRTANSCY